MTFLIFIDHMILQQKDKLINIYTDGACFGNPGPGGWAFIYYLDQTRFQNSGGSLQTTNNRMELTAVLRALEKINDLKNIVIYSDSKYVIDGATKWIIKWRKNNWKNSNKQTVKNIDLWIKIDGYLNNKKIGWQWVKGHAGNILNEEVDILAKKEASKFINQTKY